MWENNDNSYNNVIKVNFKNIINTYNINVMTEIKIKLDNK